MIGLNDEIHHIHIPNDEIQRMPNLERVKIYNKCHKFKNETFKKMKKSCGNRPCYESYVFSQL